MTIPLQYTNFEVFYVAFLIGAFTHNWVAGLGFVLLILHSVFWASDFVSVTDPIAIWFHIWLTGIALGAGIAGHIYAKAMKCSQLILISTLRSVRENVYIPLEDILVFLFAASTVLVAVGINLWLGRTIVGGGGLSPINEDLITPGIGVTIGFAFLMVLTTIAFVVSNYDGRVTLKYLWLIIISPLALVLNEIGFYDLGWADPWPQLLSLGVMLLLLVIVWLIAYKAPVLRRRKMDEVSGTPVFLDTSLYDPLYGNKNYSLAYFGGIFFISLIGWLALNIIASWREASLETGAIVMVAYCAVIIIIMLIVGFVADKQLERLRRIKIVETSEVRSAFISSELAHADGSYSPVVSERQHPLGRRFSEVVRK